MSAAGDNGNNANTKQQEEPAVASQKTRTNRRPAHVVVHPLGTWVCIFICSMMKEVGERVPFVYEGHLFFSLCLCPLLFFFLFSFLNGVL